MHSKVSDFKYIKNISNGVGEIRIYEQIGTTVLKNGREIGISGSLFANEMAYLKTVCNKINIRINSEGGSVLDGYAIYSSIMNSGIETESFIDGVAASTAGWCALAANKCNIADYGSLMVHGATGSEDNELISLANGSIAKMLSNRTGMSEEETKALMNTETWYKAFDKKDRETLISKKFVDNVITTGKKVKIANNQTSGLAAVYNSLINPKMSKINQLLKLSNNAEVEEQETAIAGLTKEIADKNTELETVKAELKTLKDAAIEAENKAKEALKNRATEMVNKFEKEGKLSKEEVASTIENASKDEASFNFVSNLLSKLGSGKQSQKPFKVENVAGDDRSKWTYNDWEKKDLEGLTNMYNTDLAQFNELVKTRKVQK